jgi:cobalt/nickel transport system permease protein
MLNFSIPGTGSSGHLGGGLILTILLGPWAGFLVMSSVLAVQAVFFADGGLLAFGCNVLNLGFFTCFVAYPLVYKNLAKEGASFFRQSVAAIFAAIIGLQLGAFGVVLETVLSGKTELPFGTFVLLMQPIHLAIGLIEGIVTAAVIAFVKKASPALLDQPIKKTSTLSTPSKNLVIGFAIATVLAGTVFAWFASSDPDGLEWAINKTAGTTEPTAESRIHRTATDLKASTAIMPDYEFKNGEPEKEAASVWPNVNAGTSVSGIVGSALTLLLAGLIGLGIRLFARRGKKPQ